VLHALVAVVLLAAPEAALPCRAGACPPPRSPEMATRDEAARLLGLAIAGEPDIETVQRAAEARAAASRADGESWRKRARIAGMLPRLVAEYRHDDRTLRAVGVSSGEEMDYIRANPGDTVQVRLDWNLDGFVFGRSELPAAAAAEQAAAKRLAAAERATKLYYERLRLRVALAANPPSKGRARADLELDLASVTGQLNALTGLYGEGRP
jgi:hypothetical protein